MRRLGLQRHEVSRIMGWTDTSTMPQWSALCIVRSRGQHNTSMDATSSDRSLTTECHLTAKSFLSALCDAERWVTAGAWYSPWVFRGQRDSNWSLVPSAWRTPSSPSLRRLLVLKEKFKELSREVVIDETARAGRDIEFIVENVLDAYAQGRAEFQLVLEFVEMADRLGHPVPGMHRYASLRDYNWVPELRALSHLRFVIEASPATTLAQHHGIPTRFLDWTRSAATAAFFAASEVETVESDGSIAVWAIRPDLLMRHGAVAVNGDDAKRYLAYEVPRAENAYLRAQDGLFLHPAAGCMHFVQHGTWPSFERFALLAQKVQDEPVIRKLTLPMGQAGEVLRLLWLNGVSRAHLMPTYDNITSALISKWKWHP